MVYYNRADLKQKTRPSPWTTFGCVIEETSSFSIFLKQPKVTSGVCCYCLQHLATSRLCETVIQWILGGNLHCRKKETTKKKTSLGSMCERDFPLSSCKPGGSLSLSFGQTETREEQIKKLRQEGGIKRSLFSCLSFLIWRRGGFNLLCVVCTPRDDMTTGFRLLHQHVNRQLRCGMSFVCLWGPNDTLTAVCMRFL